MRILVKLSCKLNSVVYERFMLLTENTLFKQVTRTDSSMQAHKLSACHVTVDNYKTTNFV
jgi:hypothetical protein